MMKLLRQRLHAVGVAVALLAGSFGLQAQAQVHATVLLKSGERLEGTNLLYAIDYGQVVLRTSFAEEPRIAVDRVAVIDFTGDARDLPPRELRDAQSGEGVLVLRDGTRMRGTLIRASHTDLSNESSPYFVTFRPNGRPEQRFEIDRISRIYFPPSPGAATGTSGDQVVRKFTVPANTGWLDTGILVRQGDKVSFAASGEIRLSANPDDFAGPGGAHSERYAPRAPLAGTFAGALIGRVGDSQPFVIGDQTGPMAMPRAGRLMIGINDDVLSDNTGDFSVTVTAPPSVSRDRKR